MADDLLETEGRGRVLAGAKTQSGIENHDRLVFFGPTAAPTGLDQERTSDFQRFEMTFPRFRPVLVAHALDFDAGGRWFEPAFLESFQRGADFAADFGVGGRRLLQIDGDE